MRKFLSVSMVLLLCSGCALMTSKIDVPYQPASVATVVPGASNARVSVTATDSRATYRDRVGTKKNGYGMEMAAIIPNTDPATSVQAAFMQELAARGFQVGRGGATIQLQLVRFYNDFKPGFFSGDSVATVAFNISVVSADSTSAFSKYYEGTGTAPDIQIMGGDNARDALTKAFAASVSSALADPGFIRAVMAAGAPARSAVVETHTAS